jgi:hypothetical protein
MAGPDALSVAALIYREPMRVADWRDMPLPDGTGLLLRIACGEKEALAQARDRSLLPESELIEAAVFALQQLLFNQQADPYRTLGAKSDATQGELRQNYRWLMKWLHPDRQNDGWEAVHADRVNRAWQLLKTPERRARHDAERPIGLPGVDDRSDPAAFDVDAVGRGESGLIRRQSWVAPKAAVPQANGSARLLRRPRILLAMLATGAIAFVGFINWMQPSTSTTGRPSWDPDTVQARASDRLPRDQAASAADTAMVATAGADELARPTAGADQGGNDESAANTAMTAAPAPAALRRSDPVDLAPDPTDPAPIEVVATLDVAPPVPPDPPAPTDPQVLSATPAIAGVRQPDNTARPGTAADPSTSPEQPEARLVQRGKTPQPSAAPPRAPAPTLPVTSAARVSMPAVSTTPIEAGPDRVATTTQALADSRRPAAQAMPPAGLTVRPELRDSENLVTPPAQTGPARQAPVATVPSTAARALVHEFAAAYSAGDTQQFNALIMADRRGRVLEQMQQRLSNASMRYLEVGDIQWREDEFSLHAMAPVRDTYVPAGERKAVTRVGQMRWELRLDDGVAKIAGLEFDGR